MQIIRNDEIAPHQLPGLVHRTIAGHAQGVSTMEVWHQVMAPGSETPVHRHACEEVVFVVSGSGRVVADGASTDFQANSTLIVPADAVHQIANTGSEPLVLITALGAAPVRVRSASGDPLPIPWHAPTA